MGAGPGPDKLSCGLGRYEVHLDRKLERMLSMLPCGLKELRHRKTDVGQLNSRADVW